MLLAPHFVAGLAHFAASHQGPYGTIRSAWQKAGPRVEYTCTVPPGTTATLTLPVAAGQAVYEAGKPLAASSATIRVVQNEDPLRTYRVEAGTYRFSIQ